MKYYVEENVSQRSCTTIRHVIKMLSTISETLIFFFLGVVTITTEHEWNWAYIVFTLVFAFVWRGLGKNLDLFHPISEPVLRGNTFDSLHFVLQVFWC